MRPSFLLLAFSLLTWSSAPARTNVVLILIDDFGYECVTATGGESYRTPVMDKLAAANARVTELEADIAPVAELQARGVLSKDSVQARRRPRAPRRPRAAHRRPGPARTSEMSVLVLKHQRAKHASRR